MRRILIALAASLLMTGGVMSVASCSTIGGIPSRITIDEKALYVVELAYAGALATVEAGVDSGAIQGETAAEVSVALEQANSAIHLAREAYEVGDRGQAAVAIAEAHEVLATLRDLISRN